MKASGSVLFDDDEVDRIERAQVAIILHMKPSEVDEMSVQDIGDVLAMNDALKNVEAWRWKKARGARR